MSYALSWVLAFALTQSIEMGVYVQALEPRRALRERLAVAFAASGVTNPILWLVMPELSIALGGWYRGVALGEACVVLVEAAFLWAFGARGALAWSLFANLSSYVVGLFLYTHFPDW